MHSAKACMHSAEFTASPSPDCAPGSCGMPPLRRRTDASASMMACTRAISASTRRARSAPRQSLRCRPPRWWTSCGFTMPCFLFQQLQQLLFMWFSSFKSKSSVDFLQFRACALQRRLASAIAIAPVFKLNTAPSGAAGSPARASGVLPLGSGSSSPRCTPRAAYPCRAGRRRH